MFDLEIAPNYDRSVNLNGIEEKSDEMLYQKDENGKRISNKKNVKGSAQMIKRKALEGVLFFLSVWGRTFRVFRNIFARPFVNQSGLFQA